MGTIKQRITVLEKNTAPAMRAVLRIICAGAAPTPDEQAQIDEAEARGDFVIVRLFVNHAPAMAA